LHVTGPNTLRCGSTAATGEGRTSSHHLFALLGMASAFIAVVGPLARLLRRVVAVPLVATAVGAVLAAVSDDVRQLGGTDPVWLCEQGARLSLAMALVGIALRIGPADMRRRAFSAVRLLIFAMAAMWAIGTMLIRLAYSDTLVFAALLAAVLTPTDPIVASSIVSGRQAQRSVPERIRQLVSLEAGSNDGIAYGLVLLPLTLVGLASTARVSGWFTHVVLFELALGGLVGLTIGIGAGLLLSTAVARGWAETPPVLVYGVALGLLILAVAELCDFSTPFAVFLGGLGFRGWIDGEVRARQQEVAEGFDDLITLPVFLLFGAVLPWREWAALGPAGVGAAALVVVFRRLPALWLGSGWLPGINGRRDALFVGWFGPIGVSSLLYAAIAVRHGSDERVWSFCTLAIALSVLVYGITAAPFIRWYGRSVGRG